MRRRSAKPGQIGPYWLSKRPGSPFWHRTWYDADRRQTRRESLDRTGLDATDFDAAQIELAAYVLETERPRHAAPQSALLSVVLNAYCSDRGIDISGDAIEAQQYRAFTAFWPAMTVAQITKIEQERYIKKRRADGVRDSSIDRELTVMRSAFRRAVKAEEITSAPFVHYVEDARARRSAEPKGRPLSLEEVARLFNAARTPRTRCYLLILANTLCRSAAALELAKPQVDFDADLVKLNPPGRRQTKKHRPIVPLTKTLRPWLATWKADRFMQFGSQKVTAAKNLWRALRAAAGLDAEVNSYSIRHTMARELRRRRVPSDQIELMLGHRLPGETTQIYAPYDPDYCREAAAAIDEFMEELQKRVAWRIVGPGIVVTEERRKA